MPNINLSQTYPEEQHSASFFKMKRKRNKNKTIPLMVLFCNTLKTCGVTSIVALIPQNS